MRSRTLGIQLLLLVFFFVQALFFIRANSQTFDEAAHVAAGYSYLATNDFRLNSEHPPLTKLLQALPLYVIYRLPFNPEPQQWQGKHAYAVGYDLLYKSAIDADRILLLSRLPNLLLGGTLIVFIGRWAYRLWGAGAATLGVTVAAFDPNLIAHSSLVTNDMGLTLFLFLTLYFLWEYTREPKRRLLAAAGIAAGLALASKFSAILLIPIVAAVIVVSLSVGERADRSHAQTDRAGAHEKIFKAAATLLPVLVVAAVTVLAAYCFQGLNPWLSGLRESLALAEAGRPAFFLGGHGYEGWWSYFIAAFAIKTPIGSLILIAVAIVLHRFGAPLRRREVIFLMLPPLLFLLAASQSNVNIGLRHILPIYPFLFVAASRLATVRCARGGRLAQGLIAVPLVLTALSSLRIAPHQLAYFNEFIGGPEHGYRYLSDSNLDWGQDLKGLKAYMQAEDLPIIYLSYFGTAPPGYYGIRYQFVPGTWPLKWPPPADKVPRDAARKILAISVYNLQDVGAAHDPLFRWLRARQPVAKIGYSIFVYDLTEDAEGLAELARCYAKAGIENMF
jgi:hypothetical protein